MSAFFSAAGRSRSMTCTCGCVAAASSTARCAAGSMSERSVLTTSAAPSPGPERAGERLDRAKRVLALRRRCRSRRPARQATRRCGSPSASRPTGATTGWATGVGTCTTGTGETAAIASATNRDPAQTSSSPSNPRAQCAGNDATSHHHRPTTWRPSNGSGPSSSRTPGIPSGFTQTSVTGCGAGWGPGTAGAPRLETGSSATGRPGRQQRAAHLARGLADAEGRAQVPREIDADGAHGAASWLTTLLPCPRRPMTWPSASTASPRPSASRRSRSTR